jgi:SET domain-containing protein
MNHGQHFNATTTPPRYIQGKWRIGFLAVRDIVAGEEVLWDYGVRGEEEREMCESVKDQEKPGPSGFVPETEVRIIYL